LSKEGVVKKNVLAIVAIVAVLMAVPSTSRAATAACDSFGKTWSITFGPFGGSFPLTLVISGDRDTTNLLGCNPLPLDGTSSLVGGLGGLPLSLVYSITAYNTNANCVSTHWSGAQPLTPTPSAVITGNVSNPAGPFGGFTLTLGSACPASAPASSANDPSR
jgi:hypothetical protein